MRFEDEVSLSFRALGYPFTISKTALGLAGAPQSWPKLLAALSWLVHRIENIDAHVPTKALDTESNFQTLEDLERITDQVFFECLFESYRAFMTDDEDALEFYEAAFKARIEIDDNRLENHVERAVDINANFLERIQEQQARVDE